VKYVKAITMIFVFVVVLLIVYVSYIKLFKVDVVFYSSLYAALIAVVIFGAVLFLSPSLDFLSTFEKAQQLAVCLLIGYIFAISVPTVIDRSLSFYILEKLQQRGGGIQLSQFDYVFTEEYLKEHRLIDVRLTEQEESGTIVIDGDCVKLTSRGERLATFSRNFRKNFLPKNRLLRGEYTDDLTDPFVKDSNSPDYLCD